MTRPFRSSLLALATLSVLVGASRAGSITTYSDRSAFETAMGPPLTVEDFTDDVHFPISTGVLNSATDLVVEVGSPILPGDIQAGVTYSTQIGDSFFFNIDGGGGFEGGFLDGFVQSFFPNVLTIAFDGPTAGFGFDTNLIMGTSFEIAVHFSSGPDYVNTFSVAQAAEMEFFGFTSDQADITSVEILSDGVGGFSFALDNFTFGPNMAVVPEPSSVVLAGLGGVLAVVGARRRTR